MSATTPRRTNMSAHHSPSKSPTRRVLGNITPKAVNSPAKHTHALEPAATAMKPFSAHKQAPTLSPQLFSNKENLAQNNALQAGRKRSIYEVDGGAGDLVNTRKDFGARDIAFTGTMKPSTGLPLDSIPMEDMNEPASPTVINTSSPVPHAEEEPDNRQEPSNSQQSFSEFLDLGQCASQPSLPAAVAVIEDKPSKAEMLRLRLGFAFHKLKTNQVEKRSSEVISNWESASATSNSVNASTNSATTATATSTSYQSVPNLTLEPASDEPVMHIQATLEPGNPIPKLTGGPVLLPTAYSSRNAYDYDMPSSPPLANSPRQLGSPIRTNSNSRSYNTPTGNRARIEEEEDSEDDFGGIHGQHLGVKRTVLTSSAVKGNAAKGLLELMSGRR